MSRIYVHWNCQSAIRTQSNMYDGRSKHISHKYNIVKLFLFNIIIFIDYTLKEKIMDLLIKGLSREFMCNSLRGMNLKSLKDERV